MKADDHEDESEINHDVDFVLEVDGSKVMLRAANTEEKTDWVKALCGANLVRSYSSKNLSLSDQEPVSFPDLTMGDLELAEVLGSGTTGTVKLAVHIPTGIRCAVKIIAKRKFFFNAMLQETIAREIEILNKMRDMNHKNVVKCYGHIDDPSYIYIVMELCEGGELLEQLEHIEKYTEEDTSEVIRTIIATLGYLHGLGIVHRDIKPENLLLATSTDLCNIKIADFGLANMLDNDGKGKDSMMGSPAYMAPEIQGGGVFSGACDLYSVGVMMYLMLCGSLPFKGATALEDMKAEKYDFIDPMWESISDGAKDVITKLLKADPEERLSSADAMEHPWVTGETAAHEYLEGAQRKIGLFMAKRKFKGIAHAVIASNRMKNLMAGLMSASKEVEAQASEEGVVMQRQPLIDFEGPDNVVKFSNPLGTS